ncbi:zinc ribbon domain-containing protein [Cyanobacterium aponinum UTEX 3222]|uniref:zinc ribbon domain-containing protein n=1 Tax=Cyanobacterium aponinum TaxID=379064 RepID=UPI0030886207|nr:zinc ribbon domain-containing protein [Cyanobacterium aponinum UTEX 3222]
MWNRIRDFIRVFFAKSRKIEDEPINKVSLIVIIIIDLFILGNVFYGLDDISRWPLSPTQAYPCYQSWQNYQEDSSSPDNYQFIRDFIGENQNSLSFNSVEENHLGKMSPLCLQYESLTQALNSNTNQNIVRRIDEKNTQIRLLEDKNKQIRQQYDSTLLEEIAGQPRELSINEIEAKTAKEELTNNQSNINLLTGEIKTLKGELLNKNESVALLNFVNSQDKFSQIKSSWERANFWYPTIQLLWQMVFLVPLIIISSLVHKWSDNKGYGLVSLMSWHLLVIFFIPLLIKLFEFLQIGFIFESLLNIVTILFGGLLFLVSYLYIFIIPLVGFLLIKFFQKFVFNPYTQASKRVEKSRCLRCGKKINHDTAHCPHCGFYQYQECSNCHNLTYKYLSYCYHCGTKQNN